MGVRLALRRPGLKPVSGTRPDSGDFAISFLRALRLRMSVCRGRPKVIGEGSNDAFDPDVWSGRALQVDFAEPAVSGLASMYPVSDWSCFAPDHHGYQRACDLVNGPASTGHLGHQCAHALGRPNLHLVSSSRRPRLETVERVTSWLAPQFLCSSQGPFLRPGPQNVDRDARRGGQGRPSHLACGWLRRCQAAP